MTILEDTKIALAHWIGVAADLREESERVQRERNSLLAALQFALPVLEDHANRDHQDAVYEARCVRAVKLAQDAIARARVQK
jgi:hypothetical protein